MESTLYKISLWTFFASMIVHFVSLYPKQTDKKVPKLMGLGMALTAVGFISLTVLIAERWIAQSRIPISSSFEYINVLTWCVVVIYFTVMYKVRSTFIAACLTPVLFLGIVFAGMYPMRLEMTLVPALQSYWLKIHVSMTIVGEAMFALAFVAGILYLIKNVNWQQVDAKVRIKSFNLLLISLGAGLVAMLIMNGAGIALQELDGFQMVAGMLGGAFLVAMPLFAILWRKMVNSGDSGFGGLIFALTVVSLIISGMGLASVKNRDRIRLEGLMQDVQAVDQLSQLAARNGGNIDAPAWQDYIQGRKQDLETVIRLESLQAERKHSLTANEAEQVMAGSTLSGKLQFPLSLGEIREQRQKLTLEVHHLESIIERVGVPATAQRLFSMRSTMVDDYNKIFGTTLIPPGSHTESVFLGLMLLFGIPVFAIFYWLSPRIQSRIPSLEVLDSLAYRIVGLGFPVYTFGALICGAIWAHYAWGKWWSNDPKEMGALIVWLTFLIYLHSRYVRRWSGNQAAVAAILGFMFAMLSFVGNSILGGLHSYG